MIDFKIELGKVKLRGMSPIMIGIKEPKLLYGEKRRPQQSIGGHLVATEDRTKTFGQETDAKSLESVWKKTKLKRFFRNQLKKDVFIFATIWKEEIKDGEKVDRAYLNTAAAIMKKAYMAMATTYTASIIRARIKGHKLFAIGTGQTLKAIKAWFKYDN